MGNIIALANLKGGVGKTVSAICLAGELVVQGCRVLVVDADPQAGATISCGFNPVKLSVSLVDCLVGESVDEAILSTSFGVDLLPANLDLALGDLHAITSHREIAATRAQEFNVLRQLLTPLRDRYDWIVIDTQPSFSRLTVGALIASDYVLIPVSCDVLGLRGLELMFRALRMVVVRLNSSLKILGVLPTMYDQRTLLSREMVDEIKNVCNGICPVFTPVRRSVRFQELPLSKGPIRDYAPEWNKPYEELAKEVLHSD